jgi:hypothetical protein
MRFACIAQSASDTSDNRKKVTAVLEDAVLLLGVSRHLSRYVLSPAHASLESLQFGGEVYEMAWRLRNAPLSPARRIEAMATEAAIGRRRLQREILPTLQQLGWLECNYDAEHNLASVDPFIPPDAELVAACDTVLTVLMATSVQRAALALIRATSRQPLEESAALEAAAACGDSAAVEALAHLESIQLIRKVSHVDGRTVVFNPNIWAGNDEQVMRAALNSEDAGARQHVGALLDEISAAPGIPESHVRATEKRWIDFAVAMGLVQRSVVQTSGGDEKSFLFPPHLGRDPFGSTSADPSGHVRQLVGSMIYASTFANWKLRNPAAFLHRLVNDGVAGDVTEIGEDYPMLETAGTIQVVPGSRHNTFRMQLLQIDVAEQALEILDSRDSGSGAPRPYDVAILGDQRAYTHLEAERARLAQQPLASGTHTRLLLEALRDTTARRSFDGR